MKLNFQKWKKEKRLTVFFTISTLVVLFLVLITTYCLFFNYAKIVSDDDNKNTSNYNKNMATILQASYLKKSSFDNLIKTLSKQNALGYAYILDSNSNKVIWATKKEFVNLFIKNIS